jgi:hypothetical protein
VKKYQIKAYPPKRAVFKSFEDNGAFCAIGFELNESFVTRDFWLKIFSNESFFVLDIVPKTFNPTFGGFKAPSAIPKHRNMENNFMPLSSAAKHDFSPAHYTSLPA